MRVYTNSFTKTQVETLALVIDKKKFGIYTGVLQDNKNLWILTIGAKHLDLLRDTVRPHFHPSMMYRIGL